MRKITLIASCALLATSVISSFNNQVGKERDSISYGNYTTTHTEYSYDSDGKTYEIKGEGEKRECQILPSGEILRYSEYGNQPVKVLWILSELADFSEAIKRLRNETDVRYSINSTEKTIILKYPSKIFSDSDVMHVYKLSYEGTYYDEMHSSYYLSKIVYDVENDESGEYTFDISRDHNIISIIEVNGYENPETKYIYKRGNYRNDLFCSIQTESDFEGEGGSYALTFYYYDENNRLKKMITNKEIIFTDYEENGEKEITRYEETITELTYKDGKLIESITKSRESI